MDVFAERAKKVHDKLLQKAHSIGDETLRSIVLGLLENPVITFTKVEPRISFYESPAAPKKHHAYPGGLLDHTLGVTEIAEKLIDVYTGIYGANVDRDLVIAAALLHDLFKYYQYERDPLTGGYRPRSDWYFSHDFAMVAELSVRGAPDKLIRVVAETHGTVPFSTIESQIVHQADTTDSQMVSQIQDVIWRACLDIELELGDVKAIKVFNEAMKRTPIFEYAKIYYTRGRDELREFIKKLLGLEKQQSQT
ncbi:MAG TPA: HDIG domain-containing protein [Pyrodictium delaneyi]|uniref:HDIG domain-containing protein n=1 Tax=Pyrodictium delaneyi TaxID=1273541 RepID=A0A833E8X9_9CREN|nr:HDIG domain-containing protein [Pyrodictium delaneyi]